MCFARLIGLLLGDLGQRPMHRAPSTVGGCNAEASRRYLLESRALDPERQRLLLVLPGLELRGPRAVVAPVLCLLYGIACFSHAHHSSFTTLDLVIPQRWQSEDSLCRMSCRMRPSSWQQRKRPLTKPCISGCARWRTGIGATTSTNRKDGRNMPTVETVAPQNPATRYPDERGDQSPRSARRISPARSPITTQGAIVLPVVTRGMMEPSAIRRLSIP